MSDCEKGILAIFHLTTFLHDTDYFVNFELLYRNIRNLDSLSTLILWKHKQKKHPSFLIEFILQPFSKDEFLASQNLHENRDTVQKSYKCISAVIVDKIEYLNLMENLLTNITKFEKIAKNDGLSSLLSPTKNVLNLLD